MSNSVRHYPVSWDQLHRDCKALTWKLMERQKEHGGWHGIIAVARGGLVPAAIIARELNIRHVDSVCIKSYDDTMQGDIEILKAIESDGEGFLIIDDLVDTGRTGEELRKMLPKAYFATVYAKPKGLSVVDTFVTEVSQDTWILFPWDMEPQFARPLAEQ